MRSKHQVPTSPMRLKSAYLFSADSISDGRVTVDIRSFRKFQVDLIDSQSATFVEGCFADDSVGKS